MASMGLLRHTCRVSGRLLRPKLVSACRHCLSSTSGLPPSDVTTQTSPTAPGRWRSMLDSVVAYYEDCIGISEVQKARREVTECEAALQEAQKERRAKQGELKRLQMRLKDVHSELDRTTRGEDKYLDLLTEEHRSIKVEAALMADFEEAENREREAFNQLSNKVRASHEREREREERTKYWSLTASLVGALLGIAGTSIGNELRMRHIKEMLPTNQQISPILREITQLMAKEQEQILEVATFVKDAKASMCIKSKTGAGELKSQHQMDELSAETLAKLLREQNTAIVKQLDELKKLIAIDRASSAAGKDLGSVVYVGEDIESMLSQTERNLESKLKLQTLLGVVLFYSSVALAIPLIYFLFKKD